eukprot:13538412-Alexandrium_andersonii.AAC.1
MSAHVCGAKARSRFPLFSYLACRARLSLHAGRLSRCSGSSKSEWCQVGPMSHRGTDPCFVGERTLAVRL